MLQTGYAPTSSAYVCCWLRGGNLPALGPWCWSWQTAAPQVHRPRPAVKGGSECGDWKMTTSDKPRGTIRENGYSRISGQIKKLICISKIYKKGTLLLNSGRGSAKGMCFGGTRRQTFVVIMKQEGGVQPPVANGAETGPPPLRPHQDIKSWGPMGADMGG